MVIDIFRNGNVIYNITKVTPIKTEAILGIDSVDVTFITEQPIELLPEDYIVLQNKEYKLFQAPHYKKIQEGYQYKFTIHPGIYNITYKTFTQKETQKTNFTQTYNLKGFLDLWLWNINKTSNPDGIDTGWVIGNIVDTPYREIQFTDINCLQALKLIAEVYRLEYIIKDGKVVEFYNQVPSVGEIDLNSTRLENNFEIETFTSYDDFYTKVNVLGGNKNIPENQQNDNGYLIPLKPLYQDTTKLNLIKEATKIFKDEYPYYVLPIKNKVAYNHKYFLIEVEAQFEEKLQPHTTIKFLTGAFINQEFYFKYHKDLNLVEVLFPEEVTQTEIEKIRVGELVTFVNYIVPNIVLEATQTRLTQITQNWFYNQNFSLYRIVLTFSNTYYGDVGETKIGTKVSFIKEGNLYHNLRVIKKDINLDTLEVKLTVTNYWNLDSVLEGDTTLITGQISGGGSIVDSLYLGELNDVTISNPKEKETLIYDGNKWVNQKGADSSKEELEQFKQQVEKDLAKKFLSKVNPDTAQGFIEFLKGISVKELATLTQGLEIGEYTPGFLGGGGAFKMKDGLSELEVDKLTVRMIATFFEIVVSKLRHINGGLVLSQGAMTCSRVVEDADSYQCFFERGDNNEISNTFVVNDQARCQVFNEGNQKFYWRLVTAVGDDWIKLSKTVGIGDSVPAAGDEIVQLGYQGKDLAHVKRLNAQIIDESGISQYVEIDSFTLEGKRRNFISADGSGSQFTGKVSFKNAGKDYDLSDWAYETETAIQGAVEGAGSKTFFAKPAKYRRGDRWILTEDTQLLDNFYLKGQILEAVYVSGKDSDWRLMLIEGDEEETEGINLIRNYTFKEGAKHWGGIEGSIVEIEDEIPIDYYTPSINVLGDEYGYEYAITTENDELIIFDE